MIKRIMSLFLAFVFSTFTACSSGGTATGSLAPDTTEDTEDVLVSSGLSAPLTDVPEQQVNASDTSEVVQQDDTTDKIETVPNNDVTPTNVSDEDNSDVVLDQDEEPVELEPSEPVAEEDDEEITEDEAQDFEDEIRENPYVAIFDFALELIDKHNSDIKTKNFENLRFKVEFGKKYLSCSASDMSVLNYEKNKSYWTGVGSRKNKKGSFVKDVIKGGVIGGGSVAATGVAASALSGVAGASSSGAAIVGTTWLYAGELGSVLIGGAAETAISSSVVGAVTGGAVQGGGMGATLGPVGVVIGVSVGVAIGVGTYVAQNIDTDGGSFNIVFNPANPSVFEKCHGNFKSFDEYKGVAKVENITRMSVDVQKNSKMSLGIKRLRVHAGMADEVHKPMRIYDNPSIMTYLNSNTGKNKDGEKIWSYPNAKKKCVGDNVHNGFLYDSEKFIGIRNRGGESDEGQGLKFYPVAPILFLSPQDMAVDIEVKTQDEKFSGSKRDVLFVFEEEGACKSNDSWVGLFEKMQKNETKKASFFTSALQAEEIENGAYLIMETGLRDDKLKVDSVVAHVTTAFSVDGKFTKYTLEKRGDFTMSRKDDAGKYDKEKISFKGKQTLDTVE